MNSRRRIGHSSEPLYGQPIATGAACLALITIFFCSAGGSSWPEPGAGMKANLASGLLAFSAPGI
jgi:hypothetical protein